MASSVQTVGRRLARRVVERFRPELAVVPLRRLPDSRLRRLAAALHAGATGDVTDEERAWIQRIEAARDRTVTSTETVPDKAREPRTVGAIARRASQAPETALVLMKLVRMWQPAFGVELGTCVGVSSAYQAAALALNGRGRLVTLEGYATLADAARENFASLGLDNVEVVVGKFKDTLGPVLERAPVDYAFVDGHHDEAATERYFEMLLGAADEDALCVFDDINWSPGMQRAWRYIVGHDRVDWSTAHQRFGICRIRR